MNNNKYYLIQENGYEYNDSAYDQYGGTPILGFQVKARAEAECVVMNAKAFLGVSPFDYCAYGEHEVILDTMGKGSEKENEKEFLLRWNTIFPGNNETNCWRLTVSQTSTLDQLVKVAELCKSVKFFEVVEIESIDN